MMSRLSVVIAEPSAIIRCGVITLLQQSNQLRMEVMEVSDLSTLSGAIAKSLPDLLMVNPSLLGQISVAQLKTELGSNDLKVIALQSSLLESTAFQGCDEVISIYDSAETLERKIVQLSKRDTPSQGGKELSAREKEIIVHVVRGMTNKQIADALFLSTHTVIAHRRNITSKLKISSTSGLTIYAIVNKLVDLSDVKNSITKIKEQE